MKAYFASNKLNKYRKRQKLKENLKNASRFLYKNKLSFSKIVISPRTDNNQTDDELDIEILKVAPIKVSKCQKKMLAVQAKDMANISEKKYEILRKYFSWLQIPSLSAIRPVQNIINNLYTIHQNEKGVFVEPLQKIKFVCKKYIEKQNFTNLKTFKIKLNTDGTSLTKSNVNLLNFSFTLLNEVEKAKSVFGQYILGMINLILIIFVFLL